MSQKAVCPKCKHEINAEEKLCPNCGANVSNMKTNKKILKGFAVVFAAMLAFVVFSYAFFDKQKETALPGKALEFSLIDYKVIERAATGRHRLEMTIIPNSDQETATQNDLISMVMQAALEAYKKTSAPVTIVNMLAQNTGNVYADRQLAFIVYIPDQKGFDGKQSTGIWVDASACERGFTADELTYLQLWGQLHTKYTDPASGVVPLEQSEKFDTEIEQIMGKKLDTDPMLNVMREVEIKE